MRLKLRLSLGRPCSIVRHLHGGRDPAELVGRHADPGAALAFTAEEFQEGRLSASVVARMADRFPEEVARSLADRLGSPVARDGVLMASRHLPSEVTQQIIDRAVLQLLVDRAVPVDQGISGYVESRLYDHGIVSYAMPQSSSSSTMNPTEAAMPAGSTTGPQEPRLPEGVTMDPVFRQLLDLVVQAPPGSGRNQLAYALVGRGSNALGSEVRRSLALRLVTAVDDPKTYEDVIALIASDFDGADWHEELLG